MQPGAVLTPGSAGGVLTPEPRLLFETQTALARELLREAGLLLQRVWS